MTVFCKSSCLVHLCSSTAPLCASLWASSVTVASLSQLASEATVLTILASWESILGTYRRSLWCQLWARPLPFHMHFTLHRHMCGEQKLVTEHMLASGFHTEVEKEPRQRASLSANLGSIVWDQDGGIKGRRSKTASPAALGVLGANKPGGSPPPTRSALRCLRVALHAPGNSHQGELSGPLTWVWSSSASF